MIKYCKLLYLFSMLVFSLGLFAQNTTQFEIIDNEIPFTVFKTNDETLTIQDVVNKEVFQQTSSFSTKTSPSDTYWIRLDCSNLFIQKDVDTITYLKHNTFGFGALFFQENTTFVAKPIGKFDKNTESHRIRANKYYSETAVNPSHLIKGRFLFLKVNRIQFIENPDNWHFSFTKKPTNDEFKWRDVKLLIPTYINAGIGIVMCVLIFVFYLYFKKFEFLFYSIFVFLHLIYLVKDEIQFSPLLSENFSFEFNWFLDSIAMLVAISYMLFAIYYIELKKDYPFAFKVFTISIIVHALAFLVDLFFYTIRFYDGHIFFQVYMPSLTMITSIFAFGYILATIKNRISIIFLIGSIFLVIGVTTHYYLNNTFDPLLYDKFYIITGATIETVIFAFGLTYKVHLEHIEKLNFQKEAYINKTKALRAQINPHFIFNSLSSIQNLVTSNDKVGTLKYLSKFSRLTRNILESSIETNVVLRDEIKLLKDYVELESLRFDNSFTYTINVDEHVFVDVAEIPFLILQPFVENAIIHGLLPKKNGPKILNIQFSADESFVICEIDDNGIGRNVAKHRVQIHKQAHKSRGIDVTKQRLESFGTKENLITITDKKSASGSSQGTKVTIKIPL